MPPDAALLAILQFADGLFPSGGFAHSFGLETLAQDGVITSRAGLERAVAAQLDGAIGPADGAAAALAARLAAAGDAAGLARLDARLEAMKTVPEWREASRQMGRQTARAARALADDAILTALAGAIDDELTPGHHAVVFGAALGRAGARPDTAALAYLYSSAALLVHAGLRLAPVGQLDGQRVLAALRPRIARLAAAAARADVDDLWSFAPELETAGLRHAGLDTRLFRS